MNSKYGHFSLYFATAVQNRTLFRRDRGSSFQPFILVRRNKGLLRRVGDSAYWTLYTFQMIRGWIYNTFDPVQPFSPLYTDRGWLNDQGVGIQLTHSFLLTLQMVNFELTKGFNFQPCTQFRGGLLIQPLKRSTLYTGQAHPSSFWTLLLFLRD